MKQDEVQQVSNGKHANDYAKLRQQMVVNQLIPRSIYDELVLESMGTVPRHLFVPEDIRSFAYDDRPLPIGEEQTISQPFIVALMIQALELTSDSRVLEVGTGSGYGAAVLSRACRVVYTIERHKSLSEKVSLIYKELNYDNIHLRVGDGAKGWREEALFDGIVVTAAAYTVPKPLLEQLKPDKYLVIPVGDRKCQELLRIQKSQDGSLKEESLGAVKFVPLIEKSHLSRTE